MKKIIVLSALGFFLLSACQMSSDEVKKIHASLRASVQACDKAEKEFAESIRSIDSVSILSKLDALMLVCMQEQKKTENEIQIEEGKHLLVHGLKNTGLSLIKAYQSNEEKYTEYARISCLPDSLYKKYKDKALSIGQEIDDDLRRYRSGFTMAEKKVEEKYGYVLPF